MLWQSPVTFPSSTAWLHSQPLIVLTPLPLFTLDQRARKPVSNPICVILFCFVFFNVILAILFCSRYRLVYLLPGFFLSWVLCLVLLCLKSKTKQPAPPPYLKCLVLSLLWTPSAPAMPCLTSFYNFRFFCKCLLVAYLQEAHVNTSQWAFTVWRLWSRLFAL